MNREQMAYRCPNATILRVVRLEGYELEFAGMAGNGVATIRPKEGSYVDGVLWKITPKCERGLDFYEGYPHFYGKEMLTVKDRLGENHQAMAYVMSRTAAARQRPQNPICRAFWTDAMSTDWTSRLYRMLYSAPGRRSKQRAKRRNALIESGKRQGPVHCFLTVHRACIF